MTLCCSVHFFDSYQIPQYVSAFDSPDYGYDDSKKINAVYWDNTRLYSYHDVLEKEDGATIISTGW